MPAHPTAMASPRIFRVDKKSALSSGSLQSPSSSSHEYAEFDASGAPQEVHRVPTDQISSLSEEQKNEVFTKVLSAVNPQAARGLTRFDYAEASYKAVPAQSQLAVHFVLDGLLIHTESDEAREQREWLAANKDRVVELRSAGTDTNDEREATGATPPMSPAMRQRSEDDGASAGAGEGAEGAGGAVSDKALKNQFNYSERGNQTVNGSMRDREVVTEPPPCVEFGGQVTHWEIFDTYCDALDKEISQREAKEKPKKKNSEDDDDDLAPLPPSTASASLFSSSLSSSLPSAASSSASSASSAALDRILLSPSCALALKTMERLVNQNAEAAAFHDYRFSDELLLPSPSPPPALPPGKKASQASAVAAPPKGPFLPLWKFSHPEAKGLTVTSIAFNPLFSDLFAVSYGSYDFGQASSKRGLVCVYTLKNVGYPEYIIRPSGAVMSVDWHRSHAALLVCGLYGGHVGVWDVRAPGGEVLYESDDPRLKHSDVVWQVKWAADDAAQQQQQGGQQPLHFFSVSGDGRVSDWAMKKNELQVEDVLRLTPASASSTVSSSSSPAVSSSEELLVTAGGSCFDFNRHLPHLFLLGSEEGSISLYSKAHNTQHVRAFLGHHMAVYTVAWNPYHPGVFLSASADWQVKLWELESDAPVMTFDLGCPVGDVCWSPYVSSVFAVVTSDGRLRVFDLAVNKHEAVGELKVGKKARLTRVQWSAAESILTVGDDRGVVSVVKLVGSGAKRSGLGCAVRGDCIDEVRRLDRLLIMEAREDGRQPQYLRAFIAAEEMKREGKEKARLADKMAADKANATAAGANGGGSPLGSPKAKALTSPRGE